MGWDRATARETFPPFVEGKASEWYEGLPDADKCTFASLIKAFSHRYLPHPATRWEKLEEYSSRKQTTGETVDEFCQHLSRQGRDLEKQDREIMEACIRGFRPEIKSFVMEKEPHDFTQMLHFARTAQAIRSNTAGAGSDFHAVRAYAGRRKPANCQPEGGHAGNRSAD
ncbi:hypothetical protein BaRGS_00001971 [Batillaria attramentaria]|uniref:Retrotransposon gag domain-containing protein n=1 Tax=Batillaria attramentaria TaxID=370345 RepID=A0ABD0M4N1_9CAEN